MFKSPVLIENVINMVEVESLLALSLGKTLCMTFFSRYLNKNNKTIKISNGQQYCGISKRRLKQSLEKCPKYSASTLCCKRKNKNKNKTKNEIKNMTVLRYFLLFKFLMI